MSASPNIHVVNRSPERGEQLAAKWHGTSTRGTSCANQLARPIWRSAPPPPSEPIVTAAKFAEQVASQRHQRPLVILDLAVPRDFDPAVGERAGGLSLLDR